MDTSIGHRYIVRLRVSCKRWYPDQGGTEKSAHALSSDVSYDMVCYARGLLACHEMVEILLTQDHGERGVHDGIGVSLVYVVDAVEYMGEVRLPLDVEHMGKVRLPLDDAVADEPADDDAPADDVADPPY